MWIQNYRPVADSLWLSAIAAALPLAAIGVALALWRLASWKASALALTTGIAVAVAVYRMPPTLALASAVYGAAFGLFALGFIVYAAILLFDIVMESGRFDAIRGSLTAINPDPCVQALVIAFAFGAFLEGAAGAGTPVAVSASLLVGIGFSPLRAGAVSLLANTAPVAFGALGLPIVTLAAVTGLPVQPLSAAVGRLCPFVGLIVPAYMVVVMSGWSAALATWPAVLVCGGTFAVTQFLVSNMIGPYLADIISAIATMVALSALLRVWQPKSGGRVVGQTTVPAVEAEALIRAGLREHVAPPDPRESVRGWTPYLLLVVIVVLWGAGPIQRLLDRATVQIRVPFLHAAIERTPPVVPVRSAYPAVYVFNWLGAAGTACLVAALLSGVFIGLTASDLVRIARRTARRLALPELTIALVVALAFVMNYAGATATLGLATAATGKLFPFFSAYLGWLGVFLTGSATSSNALFGPLQVVSANNLHLNPLLTAAVNTCGGVTGKMVSIQSIAIAAAATGMTSADEGRLFRMTVKHSVLLAGIVGLLAAGYAYVTPGLMPSG